MKEETWFKMLAVSIILHFVIIGAFSIRMKPSHRRFEPLSSYSVNLVGSLGSKGDTGGGGQVEKAVPEPKKSATKAAPPARITKPVPARTKPIPQRKEKEVVSLSKKKVPPRAVPKETPSREELTRLEDRLKEIRKKTDYLDVTQKKTDAGAGKGGAASGKGGVAGGLPFAGEGGARVLDPATQKYMLEVWEKIRDAWGVPGASFKNLETIVTIKVRKDGRIVDITIEKRSGNRIYDESILRVLRTVDPLPAIPPSLNTDSLEIGFRFLPGDIS
jgi:colicin import membrane protein